MPRLSSHQRPSSVPMSLLHPTRRRLSTQGTPPAPPPSSHANTFLSSENANVQPVPPEIPPKLTGVRKFLPFPIAILTGALSSMVGLGGGVLLVLSLMALGLPLIRAQGTSQAAIVFTALSAAYSYYTLGGALDLPMAAVLALFSSATARLGTVTAKNMDQNLLRIILALFLMVIGSFMFYSTSVGLGKPKAGAAPADAATVASSSERDMVWWSKVAACGSLVGMLTGLFGGGGGSFLVPALSLGFQLPYQTALGTSLMSLVPPSIVSLGTHYLHGNVVPLVAVQLVCGASLGAVLGSRVATKMKEEDLKKTFSGVLVALGFYMLAKGRKTLKPKV